MRPILFVWHGTVIHSYTVMLYVGLLAATFMAAHIAPYYGLSADRTAFAAVVLIVPGIAGTRLFYVLMHWDVFRHDLRRIWRRSEGGMTVYGGLASVICSVPLLWAMNLPFAPFWDALTFGMLAGVAVAKSGCLLNGCCAGRPTAGWCGLNLPDHRGVWRRRVPSQLLEMAWAAFILLVMLLWRDHAPFAGAIFCGGLGTFAAGRFFLQKFRDDHPGETETGILQGASVILVSLALIGGLWGWLR